jgi:mannan endo-1,4-beta-mannosidase
VSDPIASFVLMFVLSPSSFKPYVVHSHLPWIETTPGSPYFFTQDGIPWTPIGQNDAITWPELSGLFRRKDPKTAEKYVAFLAAHGVTCLRLMLEYSQTRHRFIERPVGYFQPNMVRLWDDLFALCEKYGLRILLTPFDTFWMWRRWKDHPYNRANNGPCKYRSRWLLCPDTLAAIKGRLAFATKRWGGSGALFAWDLWNELHPAQADNSVDTFEVFIYEISAFLRNLEVELYGRAHPQTVSVFGPVMETHAAMADVIFRHPLLNFASNHFYDTRTINNPRNTVDSAIKAGHLVREALSHIRDNRPFFDSEHGPIYTFKNRHKTIPELFDDEYFRHMQWAHFASGGAGGGMRWPYRHPHSLTIGMRTAQQGLAKFIEFIDWKNFNRKNLNEEIKLSSPSFAVFACGDERQAVIWLLRKDKKERTGMVSQAAKPLSVALTIPAMAAGQYTITLWNTFTATTTSVLVADHPAGGDLSVALPAVATDIAVAVRAS